MAQPDAPLYHTAHWKQINDPDRTINPGFLAHLRGIAWPIQDAYQALMAAYQGNPAGIECRSVSREAWAFVLPNVTETAGAGGPWRVQYFDTQSFSGHECYNTLEEAVETMIRSGYRVPDAGALDREAATPSWALGVRHMAVMQRHQQGLLSWEATMDALKALDTPRDSGEDTRAKIQSPVAGLPHAQFEFNDRASGTFADGYVDRAGLPVRDTFASQLRAQIHGAAARDWPKDRLAQFIRQYSSTQLALLASGGTADRDGDAGHTDQADDDIQSDVESYDTPRG